MAFIHPTPSADTPQGSLALPDLSLQTYRAEVAVKHLRDSLPRWRRGSSAREKCLAQTIPRTCLSRMTESLTNRQFITPDLIREFALTAAIPNKDEETVLYLAYGSNLCAETFEGNRGIKPISQVNVMVPELALDFSLPGIPYREPCFAGTHYRTKDRKEVKSSTSLLSRQRKEKQWNQGLIGVVYEVTLKDYAHIIATEGGGAAYLDVLVTCYALPSSKSADAPSNPEGTQFIAHTLLAPPPSSSNRKPGYAQPSARYLNLITSGAAEHDLPAEYQEYLCSLQPYIATSLRQEVGQILFIAAWGPIIGFYWGLLALFRDENGVVPSWLQKLTTLMFTTVWASYDGFFKYVFGDGERTVEEHYGTDVGSGISDGWLRYGTWDEKNDTSVI